MRMRQVIGFAVSLALLAGFSGSLFAQTPTPEPSASPSASPSPTASVTPCNLPLLVKDVSAVSISTTRSAIPTGWWFHLRDANDPATVNFGYIYDNENTFHDGLTHSAVALGIKLWQADEVPAIQAGDYLTITVTRSDDSVVTGYAHMPALDTTTMMYVDASFNLYTDAELCNKISVPSPTPSPSTTPSPTPTASPEPSPSPSPSTSPSPTPTETPTPEPTGTPSPSPTGTPTPEPTGTPSPSPSASPTATQSPTPEPSLTPTPTATQSPTPSPSTTPSPTPTPSPSDQVPTGQAVDLQAMGPNNTFRRLRADENGSLYVNPYIYADTETAYRAWADETSNASLLTVSTGMARALSLNVYSVAGGSSGKVHWAGAAAVGDDSNVIAAWALETGGSIAIPLYGEVGAYGSGIQVDVDTLTGSSAGVLLKYQLQKYAY